MSFGNDETGFRVRRASWLQDSGALARVRTRVFVEEQGVPADLEWDGEDEKAVHLLACDADGQAIGTARVLGTGQIGRMAVLPAWRGRGVGSALLREALTIATAPGRPVPFLHAQASALDFYRRHGFAEQGDEYSEAGIPHRTMVLRAEAVEEGSDDLAPEDSVLQDSVALFLPTDPSPGPLPLTGRARLREASLRLAEGAKRELVIFSGDLDPDQYDHTAFLTAVRRLAREVGHLPVRILLREPKAAVASGHRLIALARHLTSRIEIRRASEDDRDRRDSFLVADGRGYCLRRLADSREGVLDVDNPAEARRLRADFEQMWERGECDIELRRLHL